LNTRSSIGSAGLQGQIEAGKPAEVPPVRRAFVAAEALGEKSGGKSGKLLRQNLSVVKRSLKISR
jgi:hypothetical protein